MILVVPMAGRGRRFGERGISTPKPLIEVAGRPMVSWAFESVRDLPFSSAVFIALREHTAVCDLHALAESLAPGRSRVLLLDQVTDGQAQTVLAAREFMNPLEGLLIASSDTFVESDLEVDIAALPPGSAGLISVAELPGDHWSFAAIDSDDRVVAVAEKTRISPYASTGLYYFAKAGEFIDAADAMIASGERTRGEFYVIPVYQRYLEAGKHIGISRARAAWDMGNPDALRAVDSHLRERRA